jgi:hypothetical protein
MSSIVFTATRSLTTGGRSVMEEVCEMFRPSVESGDIDEFISGGAVGGDTFLALTCLFMYPLVRHTICVPDYAHNDLLIHALRIYDTHTCESLVEIIDTGLDPLKRDDFMLDRAVANNGRLYAFPATQHEQRRGSGTWATIRHAKKRKMPYGVFPCNGELGWGG